MRIIFFVVLNFLSTFINSTDLSQLNSCSLVYLNGTLPTMKQDCWQDKTMEEKNCCWINATEATSNSSIYFCYPVNKGIADLELELLSDSVLEGLTVDYECSAYTLSIPFILTAFVFSFLS
jgi:hypothetical protein